MGPYLFVVWLEALHEPTHLFDTNSPTTSWIKIPECLPQKCATLLYCCRYEQTKEMFGVKLRHHYFITKEDLIK